MFAKCITLLRQVSPNVLLGVIMSDTETMDELIANLKATQEVVSELLQRVEILEELHKSDETVLLKLDAQLKTCLAAHIN